MALADTATTDIPCVCCWCKRSFASTRHPLQHVLASNPEALLPRRAPRSKECSICPRYLAECCPQQALTNETRKAFLLSMTTDESGKNQKEFDQGLGEYEQLLSKRGFGRPRKGDDMARPARKRTITVSETRGSEFRTTKGVFWPRKLYESSEFFNAKVPRRKLTKHDGEFGIVLASTAWSHIPDGCTVITQVSKAETKKEETIFDDADACRDGQEQEVWDLAKKNEPRFKARSLLTRMTKMGQLCLDM